MGTAGIQQPGYSPTTLVPGVSLWAYVSSLLAYSGKEDLSIFVRDIFHLALISPDGGVLLAAN